MEGAVWQHHEGWIFTAQLFCPVTEARLLRWKPPSHARPPVPGSEGPALSTKGQTPSLCPEFSHVYAFAPLVAGENLAHFMLLFQ